MSQLLWTQKQDVGPAARWGVAMVYDSVKERVLLFGGCRNSTNLGDTWEWDGENWTQVEDIGPPARWGHGMAYDEKRERVVLFGGAIQQATSAQSLNDTWEWDGGSWTQVADTGPSARHGIVLAHDLRRQCTVLFGGEQLLPKAAGGTLFGDTWVWDGAEWTQEQDAGPSPRDWYGMAWDKERGRVVLFGGLTYQPNDADYTMLNDTWEYDAEKWTRVADTGPSPRHALSLSYNGKAMLLFGGGMESIQHGISVYKDTWQWTGKFWTQRQDIGPGARFCAGAAGDTKRNRMVLFGGASSSTDFGDTWEQFEKPAAAPPG